MDGPRRPWLEALGLVLVLSLAAAAFLVSRQPAPTGSTAGVGPTSVQQAPGAEPDAGDAAGTRRRDGARDGRGDRGARPQRVPGAARRGLGCLVGTDSSLEVVTFNMHSGWNRDRSRQMLPRIGDELTALRADVVLLQEVDKNRIWSGRVDQAAYLADRLGMEYAFATNVLRPGDSRYGTAVLSRFPILESANTLLPRPPGTQQRGLLRVVVEAAPGERVSLYTTHLEHTSEQARIAQARAAADVIRQDPYPAVIGGDMNSRPASTAMTTLRTVAQDSWLVAGQDAGLTHPSASPRSRIDYLYTRGDVDVDAIATYPSAVSDHRAVRAVYSLGDEVELPPVAC